MGYNFTAEWVKETLNNAPDALSRNPISDLQPSEMLAECNVDNNPKNTLLEVRAIANEYQENVQNFAIKQKRAMNTSSYRVLMDSWNTEANSLMNASGIGMSTIS